MRNESQERPSPASSITKLGFVRFCPEEPGLAGDLRRIRVIELPSFSLEEPERPRVKMQRLTGRRRAWTANSGDESAASGSQRARTATLQGVNPFSVRSRGSSPAISLAAFKGTPVAGAPAPAAADARPTGVDLAPLAVSDARPTDVDLAPLGASAERSTDLGVAPLATRGRRPAAGDRTPATYAVVATPAELAAAEVETERAVLLLQRLRRLSQPPTTEAERAAMRRLRRLTQPRSSGASRFDAIVDGAEIVVGVRAPRARWRAAIVGVAVAVAAAAVGLAALL